MDSEEDLQTRKPQTGYLASVLRPLEIAASDGHFTTWLRNNTEEDFNNIVPGYVFFFETGIRAFATGASISPVLDLDYPYVLQRAEGEQVTPDKIPESNERLDFFRNLKSIQKKIRGVNEWGDINKVPEYMGPLLQISSSLVNAVEPAKEADISKETALNYATRIQLTDRFMNTRQYAPRGYGPTNLDKWLVGGDRDDTLSGYTRTLQFVWKQLLQEKDYRNSILPDIHSATVWERDRNSTTSEPALQSFYGDVRGQLLTPIDNEFDFLSRGRLVEPDDLLDANCTVPREKFESLLSPVEHPKRSELEKGDELDYILFWNDAEWLGSATFSKDATFETTLWGLATTLLREDSDFPIHIIRFKHPRENGEGNRYSYAILQRLAHQGLGDPSGWLVFYEVGTDFSGSKTAVKRVEKCIEDVGKLWPIELRELSIGLEKFRQLMATRLTDDYLQNEAEAQDAYTKLNNSRGIILELLGYFALSQSESKSTVYWSVDAGAGEIDLIVEKKSQYRVIECKTNPSTVRIEKEITKLRSKAEPLKQDNSVNLEFFFWNEPSSEVSDVITSTDMDYSVLSNASVFSDISLNRIENTFDQTLRTERFNNPLGPVRRLSGVQKDLFWYFTLLDESK